MADKTNTPLASSTGHNLSDGAYLDRHFVACQPEYEAMLTSVGLQAGWHVLDAGCGSGSFLSLMSKLIGPSGQIQAIDLDPDNVTLVEKQQMQNTFACPVTVRVGNLIQLPYEDDSFDAVWCANITQYLNDGELDSMLNEFKRVLMPGGLIALKDACNMCWQLQPLDPLLWPRLRQAEAEAANSYLLQILRNPELPTRVKRTGFKDVQSKTIVIERWQPLREIEQAYMADVIGHLAALAQKNANISEKDRLVWESLADVASPNHILNHPDFYHSQGHIMIVAKTPQILPRQN